MRLKCLICPPNQKCDSFWPRPFFWLNPHQRGGRGVWSLAEGITTVRFSQLLRPPKPDSSPTNCNEIHRHVFVEDPGTDVTVTFSNWSRFLVRLLGEISPHPHKETLPARLLTRTQARKNYALRRRPDFKLLGTSDLLNSLVLLVLFPWKCLSGWLKSDILQHFWVVIPVPGRLAAGNLASHHQGVHAAPPDLCQGPHPLLFNLVGS